MMIKSFINAISIYDKALIHMRRPYEHAYQRYDIYGFMVGKIGEAWKGIDMHVYGWHVSM